MPKKPASAPRVLIVGAGSRGNAYAQNITSSTPASVVSIAEPITSKRDALGSKYIWPSSNDKNNPTGRGARPPHRRRPSDSFDSYEDFLDYETVRQQRVFAGEKGDVGEGVDGVVICTLDDTHVDVVKGIAGLEGAPLGILCEKPVATNVKGLRELMKAVGKEQKAVFAVGHVLRYSPHNMMLKEMVMGGMVGDVISVEHTEPVGWSHFAHSYVRGNWRKESTAAPSLLTKSCHDIDFLLWLLCESSRAGGGMPHLPSYVCSTGSLSYFKKSRKPKSAGNATNCLSCPIERDCLYSAEKLYYERQLAKGNARWPVDIVVPDIEICLEKEGKAPAKAKLMAKLAEDYSVSMPQKEIDARPWFGRCVWESDNDVCDDQVVTMTWEDDILSSAIGEPSSAKGAKTAVFHMIAFTEKQCERRGRIYGTKGEIEYDSEKIQVHDFATGETQIHHPRQGAGKHGGGDEGLAQQYVKALNAVKNEGKSVQEAQMEHIGCSFEDIIRSHAIVFAAEEARREKKVVKWSDWWKENMDDKVGQSK